MSRRTWLHIFAVAAVCLLALLIVSLHRAFGAAQLPHDDDPVLRGQALAEAWCMSCHRVGPIGGGGGRDLDFLAIANMPATTELSLRVFLQSSHRSMPNIVLERKDLDHIVAFILSLKRE
jgi:mono/diheme cytochrome c family protein